MTAYAIGGDQSHKDMDKSSLHVRIEDHFLGHSTLIGQVVLLSYKCKEYASTTKM